MTPSIWMRSVGKEHRVIGLDVLQHTVAASAVCAGIGVHTGQHVHIRLRPAPIGTGVVFVRTDVKLGDNRIPVSPSAIGRTQLNTEVVNAAGVSVSTIEHLMAAFAALSIDNVVVEIDGPEVPIMDGSAQPFIDLLDRAGRRRQDAARSFIEILAPIKVIDGDKCAALLPSEGFTVDFEIAFASRAIGRQRIALEVTEDSFREELADARTFGFLKDVEALRKLGLAQGGALDNCIVLDGDEIVNEGGLRREREFVRHKAMDAIGDLYVLGAPILGRLEARYAGHALNALLVQALVDQPEAWRFVTVREAGGVATATSREVLEAVG